MKTKGLITCGLFAALICVTAPVCVPVGVIPVTFVLFSVALCAFSTGCLKAVLSVGVYILIGLAGMPVFSGFKGGLAVLLSPTGGFVFSYVFVALILGCSVKAKRKSAIVLLGVAALLVCYLFGILWYMMVTKANFMTALMVCVVPFVLLDALKIYWAYILSKAIKEKIDL